MDVVDFSKIFEELEAEQAVKEEIRNEVRELDRRSRAATASLNQSHSRSREELKGILAQSRRLVEEAAEQVITIASHIRPGEYYKYNDLWSRPVQQIIFCSLFIGFLEQGQLTSMQEVESTLRIAQVRQTGFFLPVEDYLHALVSLTNELSRLAVNSVTLSDYQRPHEISKFVKEVYSGFQLLNLKNDSLRKRFDSIKYDVKKIEEVVYDISLRGLTAQGKEAVERAKLERDAVPDEHDKSKRPRLD